MTNNKAETRSCLTCKYAIKFNDYNDDGKCGNENSEAFKRNENNKTLFGSVCDLHTRETLQERLEKIDAYTFRNEWISKFEKVISEYRKTNDKFLLEISTLYEKRHVLDNIGELINRLNKEIYDNIRIKELTSIINGL